MIIGSIIGILLIFGGITLYKTFAFYEEKKEFNVLKGRIPNFMDSDVSLAFVVDGVTSEKVPARGNYIVDVTCDGGYGEWDYTAWDIVIKSFSNGTKCDITFTSVTEEEMPEFKLLKRLEKSKKPTLLVGSANSRTMTFDFSEIPGYENLTIDNFIAYLEGVIHYSSNSISSSSYNRFYADVTDYDSTTGIVTISYIYSSENLSTDQYGLYLYVTAFYY